MRPVKAGWLLFLILTIILAATGYNHYKKQTEKLERYEANVREVKKLHEQQAKLIKATTKTDEVKKAEEKVLKLLAEEKGDLWFLEDVEDRLGKSFSPTFVLIGPLHSENKGNHLRFQRQISLEATYPEMIKLLNELEKKRGFTVSKLRISQNKKAAASLSKKKKGKTPKIRHRVEFLLSCIKIKESFLTQLGLQAPVSAKEDYVESLLLAVPWKPGAKLKFGNMFNDPFVTVKKKEKRRKKASGPKIFPPIDLAGQYTLQGIIKVAGRRLALISPDLVLEAGDLLDNKKLDKIEAGQILLHEGKQKYFLQLPGDFDFGTKGKKSKQAGAAPTKTAVGNEASKEQTSSK